MHRSWPCSSWSFIINQLSWNSVCFLTISKGILPVRSLSRAICPPDLQGYIPVCSLSLFSHEPELHHLITPNSSSSQTFLCSQQDHGSACAGRSLIPVVYILWLTCYLFISSYPGDAASPAGFTEKCPYCCPISLGLCTPSSAAKKVSNGAVAFYMKFKKQVPYLINHDPANRFPRHATFLKKSCIWH